MQTFTPILAIEVQMQFMEPYLTLATWMQPLELFYPGNPNAASGTHFDAYLSFKMTYRMSVWKPHLSRTSGTVAKLSDWPTVCLGEIAISKMHGTLGLALQIDLQCHCVLVNSEITSSSGCLVRLLSLQIGLQCVSVKSPSLQEPWPQSNNGKKTRKEIW